MPTTPRPGTSSDIQRLTAGVCIIHLIRNTFRYASRKYWDQISRDLKPVYSAPTIAAAETARDEFLDSWGRAYPAIRTLWMNAWAEFVPFLDYDLEIRRVLCSTNAIESLNARFRRAVRARGHFPTEQAAMKTESPRLQWTVRRCSSAVVEGLWWVA